MWHLTLGISTLWRPKFKANLGYIQNRRTGRATQQDLVTKKIPELLKYLRKTPHV